jgi:hypothetical protein
LQRFCVEQEAEQQICHTFHVLPKRIPLHSCVHLEAATHTFSPGPPGPSRALRPSATARARFCACLSTATKYRPARRQQRNKATAAGKQSAGDATEMKGKGKEQRRLGFLDRVLTHGASDGADPENALRPPISHHASTSQPHPPATAGGKVQRLRRRPARVVCARVPDKWASPDTRRLFVGLGFRADLQESDGPS